MLKKKDKGKCESIHLKRKEARRVIIRSQCKGNIFVHRVILLKHHSDEIASVFKTLDLTNKSMLVFYDLQEPISLIHLYLTSSI